jgi:uncharacterized OsmC-like protein
MTTQAIATALQRVETVLRRRPDLGLQPDAPATACWQGGTRVATRHANGTSVATDLPDELGGSGGLITAGWLFRAGLASCAATGIALLAAAEGIEMSTLEVVAESRSDTRGLFGMTDARGAPVSAAPQALRLRVRIAAEGVAGERLRSLVERACERSPIASAAQCALPMQLQIDTGAA